MSPNFFLTQTTYQMKKFLPFFLPVFLLLLSPAVNAKKVSEEQALSEAAKFFKASGDDNKRNFTFAGKAATRSNESKPYYVINREEGGFVIIAGDDRLQKVLGYSKTGTFESDNLPPQLKELFISLEDKLGKIPESKGTHSSWTAETRSESEVLLKTALWNQWEPYNLYTPKFDGETAPAGCLATALAIIMKYNEFPKTAVKPLDHKWYSQGVPYTYDFGKMNIDYSLLRDEYLPDDELTEAEKTAIAEIMYAAQATVNMQFGAQESTAYSQDKPRMYRELFGYDEQCQFIARMYFSDEEWSDIIQDQLNNNMPVLMDAKNDSYGHAFVIDGYDTDGYYHVNWGWGGYANGYFAIDDLDGYNQYQGISINMRPADDPEAYSKTYSRQWIDGNTGVSLGGMGDAAGMHIDREDIVSGEPFNLTIGVINTPKDFYGVGGIALYDENGKIIEIADGIDALKNYNGEFFEDWLMEGRDWAPMGITKFFDIFFNSEIKDGYTIRYVTKEEGDTEWKPVFYSMDAPSCLPVKGNTPGTVNVKFNVHAPEGKIKIKEADPSLMIGDSYQLVINIVDGVALVYKDGVLTMTGSSYRGINQPFGLDKSEYNIDIYYKSFNELEEKTYNVTTPGTLASLISEEDKEKVSTLRITGNINNDDLEVVWLFPYLLHIDLENAHIVENDANRENFMPQYWMYSYTTTYVHSYESLKLPKDLKGFETRAASNYCLDAIDIPAGVDTYEVNSLNEMGWNSTLSFVNVRNPNPVELDGSFEHRSNITLLVPEGSKEAYSSHPSWQWPAEILEVTSENPYIGEYVENDNARFLIVTDFAALVGYKGYNVVDEIPDYVEYEGKSYPVKYIINAKLNAPENLVMNSVEDFNWNNTAVNNLYISYSTPTWKNLPNYNLFGTLYTPDCEGIEDYFMVQNMWDISADKDNGSLYITPLIDDIEINSIMVNGKEAETQNGTDFTFTPAESLDIKVNYTLFDRYAMTTGYADGTVGIDSIEVDPNQPVEIYNLQGLKVYEGKIEGFTNQKGIFVIKQGKSSKLIMAR